MICTVIYQRAQNMSRTSTFFSQGTCAGLPEARGPMQLHPQHRLKAGPASHQLYKLRLCIRWALTRSKHVSMLRAGWLGEFKQCLTSRVHSQVALSLQWNVVPLRSFRRLQIVVNELVGTILATEEWFWRVLCRTLRFRTLHFLNIF